LGVRARILDAFARIHLAILLGRRVVPLQSAAGESRGALCLPATETFDSSGLPALNEGTTPKTVKVTATKENGEKVEFDAAVRVDTPGEADYFRHGGILQYVLRQMAAS